MKKIRVASINEIEKKKAEKKTSNVQEKEGKYGRGNKRYKGDEVRRRKKGGSTDDIPVPSEYGVESERPHRLRCECQFRETPSARLDDRVSKGCRARREREREKKKKRRRKKKRKQVRNSKERQ